MWEGCGRKGIWREKCYDAFIVYAAHFCQYIAATAATSLTALYPGHPVGASAKKHSLSYSLSLWFLYNIFN